MKSYPKIIDRILDILREGKTFCIIGHIRPDGDCVGSQLGLTLARASSALAGSAGISRTGKHSSTLTITKATRATAT
jgi:nanoRNase/pAp phosphatase (c-di-AMP/oligoRNAs hydrolase)